jgi:hypothetical protein
MFKTIHIIRMSTLISSLHYLCLSIYIQLKSLNWFCPPGLRACSLWSAHFPISGSIPTTLHPIFPRFGSSLDLQSRKKMKQESLGPLVISKTARLTTITCRSRAPRLTSVSHPALCQKKSFNVSPVPMSLPWPGAILPKMLRTNSTVWSFRPLPHPKKIPYFFVQTLISTMRGEEDAAVWSRCFIHSALSIVAAAPMKKTKWCTSRLLSIEACSSSS